VAAAILGAFIIDTLDCLSVLGYAWL